MSSILTNNSAMVALQTLRSTNNSLAEVQSQIATGKKVASAKDNAAIFAISTVMEADVTGFQAISDSLSLGSSTVAVARNASESIVDVLEEIKGKVVAAQEENVDRTKIQADIDQLSEQITGIVEAAQFNGLNLLKGTDAVNVLASLDRSGSGVNASQIQVARNDLQVSAGAAAANLTGSDNVQAGNASIIGSVANGADVDVVIAAEAAGDVFTIDIGGTVAKYSAGATDGVGDVAAGIRAALIDAGLSVGAGGFTLDATTTAGTLTITNNTGAAVNYTVDSTDNTTGGLAELDGMDVTTDLGASDALDDIETLIDTAIDAAASFGSSEKRIEIQNDFVSTLMDSFKSGIGALVDADLEEASARFQALQVQQQLGTQALSIANQAPQALLSLFR
ncbi:MAG: flagellin [Pseudomonadota bacterium]